MCTGRTIVRQRIARNTRGKKFLRGLFDAVFSARRLARLPLHVVRRVCAAALQGHDVVRDAIARRVGAGSVAREAPADAARSLEARWRACARAQLSMPLFCIAARRRTANGVDAVFIPRSMAFGSRASPHDASCIARIVPLTL